MGKRIIGLVFCMIISVGLVVIINLYAGYRATQKNDFIRMLPSHKVIGTGFVKLPVGHWYISGIDAKYVYLGSWTHREQILRINYRTKDSARIILNVDTSIRFTSSVSVALDHGRLVIADGIKPIILHADSINGRLKRIKKPLFFTAMATLDSNSFVFRAVNRARNSTLIKRTNDRTESIFKLQGEQDGIFSTDGKLITDQTNQYVFYSYFYRNEFICLDKNLRVIYKAKTIDTVTRAKIKIGKIRSENKVTLATPPQFVKEQIAANSKYLFIHSALKADNELSSAFEKFNAIDIYNIKDGKYVFSTYIINFNEEKMRDFRVYEGCLVSLYDDYVYFHKLRF